MFSILYWTLLNYNSSSAFYAFLVCWGLRGIYTENFSQIFKHFNFQASIWLICSVCSPFFLLSFMTSLIFFLATVFRFYSCKATLFSSSLRLPLYHWNVALFKKKYRILISHELKFIFNNLKFEDAFSST